MTRVLLAGCFAVGLLAARPQSPAAAPQAQDKTADKSQTPKTIEEEPPEEDESLKPKEYTLNPIEAERNITTGNFYFKKAKYVAASRRYLEATRWNPASGEAFLRLAEADEKLKDFAGARDAYTKYLALVPDAKNASEIKKKIAKWPSVVSNK